MLGHGAIVFDHLFVWRGPPELSLNLQYRPSDDEPQDWQDGYPSDTTVNHRRVQRASKLKEHWFLVWASSEIERSKVETTPVFPQASPNSMPTKPWWEN